MINMIHFLYNHQETIHITFSSTTIKYYHSDDIYSDATHVNVGNDVFAFLGG